MDKARFLKIHRIPDLVGAFFFYRDFGTYFRNRFGHWEPRPQLFRFWNGARFFIDSKGEVGIADYIWREKVITKDIKIEDGDVVVDIGAHIGYFTVFASRQARALEIYAYEPAPEIYRKLLKNIQLNKLDGKVKAYELGVAGEGGVKEFYFSKAENLSSSLDRQKVEGEGIQKFRIKTITLEDIFETNGLEKIDFLKLNAEGAEYGIFSNTPDKYLRKVRKMFINYHNGAEPIVNRLASLGFSVTRYPELAKNLGFIVAKQLPNLFHGRHPEMLVVP